MSKYTNTNLFTSESVASGHPDKIADRVSDALLDALLTQDKNAKTGIETVVGANRIALFGEINTAARIDFETIARNTIKDLGYTNPDWGFSHESIFENYIHQQSPEIAMGVEADGGAGDQGMMFGFAVKETEALLPLPITLAHALTERLDEVRRQHIIPFLRPDGKSQVTVRYEKQKPVGIEAVVIATAHEERVSATDVEQAVYEYIVVPVLERFDYQISKDTLIVNGTGLWHIPGPQSDAGLTGRKIVVDTYGGYARVGGGAFSGKDPSKVDRSGAYAARFIAKNIVAAGLADRCEVGLAYVIGRSHPLMKTIDCFETNTKAMSYIEEFVDKLIDTSVKGIVDALDLRRPIYQQTSAYGHFGKSSLPWEQIVV